MTLGILAAAIQWGWQPLPDGGKEYIVQVEPQLTDLESFRKEGFTSAVPPTLRDIREIRIVVGSEALPNQGEIPAAPATLPAGVSAAPLTTPLRLDAPSAKVSLANGHQPAEAVNENGDATPAADNAAAPHSAPRSPSDRPVEESPPVSSATPPRPWLTLLFVTGGLIVSLSGNLFLGWLHWGARSQYRNLVSRLRSQRTTTD
jgi:hypothetical protein